MERGVQSRPNLPGTSPLRGQQLGTRLDSWKEIACYFGRNEKTVRRWEEKEELPVHRLLHEKRGSVYAYTAELDEWREARKRSIEPRSMNGTRLQNVLKTPVEPALSRVAAEAENVVSIPQEARARAAHNLPLQRTPLIGRDAERSSLRPLLVDPEIRVITLTGPGGTGKTRLAIQAAAEAAASFPAGIRFVNLAPLSDPKLVVSAIAHAFGIRETPGRILIEALTDHLASLGRSLLVLDNFEQVAPAAPDVLEILDSCPLLTALVTSRTVLRVYGEHEFFVPPLPLPESDGALSPGRLLDYPSIALFVQRARAVKPDFALSMQNADPVVQICRRLDGLPLAIELAAARIKILPPAGLLARMAGRLELLIGGARDLPERQRTLRRTIDWSYDLLTPSEQKLFRRVSVFVGGCTLEAAEAVCNCDQDVGIDLLDGVASLVDKSLLVQTGSGESEPRFIMLETIREYGRERLEQSGEMENVRRAHAAYCLVLAEEGAADMPPSEREAWLTQCDAEHDNFRTAVEYLVRSCNCEWGLRLGAALFLFWEPREHLTEGRRAMDALLAIPDPNPASKQRASALYTAGILADIQLDSSSAFELHSANLEIQRQRGDKHGIALALNALGIVTHKSGRSAEGRSYTEEALLLWEELGSGVFLLGLHNLANIATKQRDYQTARVTYEMTLEAFRSTGDNRGMAVSLNGLGDVAAGQGDHARARELFGESLKKYREIGDPGGAAAVLRDLGDLACSDGDGASACALYKEALCIFHRIGHRRGMAPLLQRLARCAIENGQPDCALTLLAAAAVLREKLGISISAPDSEELDQTLGRARESLPAIDRDQAWSEGRLMSIDRLVEYALER